MEAKNNLMPHDTSENNFNNYVQSIATLLGRYNVFSNTTGTGMDALLRLLRVYLDETSENRPQFTQLHTEEHAYHSKYLHSCRVLYLDFSDFSCKNCEDARKYLAQKMSQLYKEHIDLWEWNEEDYHYYRWAEECLDIIEQKTDDARLQRSLQELLYQANHRKLWNDHTSYVVLLINNMVLLEEVAAEYQYEDWMDTFLMDFIVEDIYKFCDTFLQIGELPAKKQDPDHWSWDWHGYRCYYAFSVSDEDIWEYKDRYPFADSDFLKQDFFVEVPTTIDTLDWNLVIQEKRKIIEKQKEKEQIVIEEGRIAEMKRYQKELPESFPKVSSFLGIRKLEHVSYSTEKLDYYHTLLQQIYAQDCRSTGQIYEQFQKIMDTPTDITCSAKQYLQQYFPPLENSTDHTDWKIWINEDTYWVYFGFSNGQFNFVPTPYMLKAYVSLQCTDICEVFFQSLIYLKKHAQKNFGAKVSKIDRADQMCYWISPTDLSLLYDYYASYYEILKCEMEFVAYRNKIGISRDFGNEVSHNQMQAELISTYFNIIQSKEEIDLLEMYRLFVEGWNGALSEEHPFTKAFKYTSAASFLVLLETLQTILQKDSQLPEDSLLLTENRKLWGSLCDAKCWGDLETDNSSEIDTE